MHCISALAAGIRGAEDGYVVLYQRGTGSLATWYTDSDGNTPSSGQIPLDSYGSAVVYVDEQVDVNVYASGGVLVRQYTEIIGAGLVQVRSASFTGLGSDGSIGVGKDVALSTLADRWASGANAPDWKVLFGGEEFSMGDLVSHLTGLITNVKAAPYMAVGDGVADDTAAIQNALDDAETNGSAVVFPAGTYRCTDQIVIRAKRIVIVGMGAEASILRLDSGVPTTFVDIGTPTSGTRGGDDSVLISGLTVTCGATATATLVNLSATADLAMRDCVLTTHPSAAVAVFFGSSGVITTNIDLQRVKFTLHNATQNGIKMALGIKRLRLAFCIFTFGTAVATWAGKFIESPNLGDYMFLVGCIFDPSLVIGTDGAWSYMNFTGSGIVSMTGCMMMGPGFGSGQLVLRSTETHEFGNYIHPTTTFFGPVTEAVTDDVKHSFGTIDARVYTINSSTGGFTIPVAGMIRVNSSYGGGSPNFTFPAVMKGRKFILIVHNSSGVGYTIATTGPVVGASMTVSAGTVSTFMVIAEQWGSGTLRWRVSSLSISTTP